MAVFKIYNHGKEINRIVADENFCKEYCSEQGYTYELQKQLMPSDDMEPAYSPNEIREQEITDLQLSDIEQWQEITEIQIQLMEVNL